MNIRKYFSYKRLSFIKYSILDLLNVKLQLLRFENRKKLRRYKDMYLGERCFIIGNGPSLNVQDLELLKGEKTFAVNRIYDLFEVTAWRPDFYCVQDGQVINGIGNDFEIIEEQVKDLFLRVSNYKKYSNKVRKADNVNLFHVSVSHGWEAFLCSDDISKFVYEGNTVIYSAIQIALYMGFKEINLLGIDHSYATQVDKEGVITHNAELTNYAKGMKQTGDLHLPRMDLTTMAFLKADIHAKKRGAIIRNATRGGKLEVFERKSIEEIIKKGVLDSPEFYRKMLF